MKYFKEMSEDNEKMRKDPAYRPRYPEMQETYEEVYCQEKNRERYENRWYRVCKYAALLTKTQKEWPFIKTVGQVRQIRILMERDGADKKSTLVD